MANKGVLKRFLIWPIVAAIIIAAIGGLVFKNLLLNRKNLPAAICVEPFGNTSKSDMDYVDLQGCAEIIRMAVPAFAKIPLAQTILCQQLFWTSGQPVTSREDAELLADKHNCRFVVHGVFREDKGSQLELVVTMFDANRGRWYEDKFPFEKDDDSALEEQQLRAAILVVNKINELLKNKQSIPKSSSVVLSASSTDQLQALQKAALSLEPVKTVKAINNCAELLSEDATNHQTWTTMSRLYWSLGFASSHRYRSLYKNYFLKSYAALRISEMLCEDDWQNKINRAMLYHETFRIRPGVKLAYEINNEKPDDLMSKAVLCLCLRKEKPLKDALENKIQAPMYYYILAMTLERNGKATYAADLMQSILHPYPNCIDAARYVCIYNTLGVSREFLSPYANRTNFQILELLYDVSMQQNTSSELEFLLKNTAAASGLHDVNIPRPLTSEKMEDFLQGTIKSQRKDWELGLQFHETKNWPKNLGNIIKVLDNSPSGQPSAVNIGQSSEHWFEYLSTNIHNLQHAEKQADGFSIVFPGFFYNQMKLELANFLLQTCQATQASFLIERFGSYSDSEEIMIPWKRLTPDEPEFNVLARIYAGFEHPLPETIERSKLYTLDPQADILYELSSVDIDKKTGEYRTIFEKARQVNPRNARLVFWLGRHYRELNKRAIEHNLDREAYQLDPYDPWVVDRYLAAVGGQEGVKGYHKAGEEMDENIDMLNTLGWVFSNYWPILDEPKAIGYYRKSIEECPHNLGTYNRLSDIYLRNGKMQECLDLLKTYLDIDSDSLSASSMRTRIGRLYRWMKQPEKARPFLEQSARTWQGDAMLEYARCLSDLKEYEESVFFLERCIDRYEPYYEAREELAHVYDKWGKPEQANQTLKAMLEKYNTDEARNYFNLFFDNSLDYDRYIKVFETLVSPVVRAEELDRLTRGYVQRSQWDKAIEYGKACLPKIPESKISPEAQISWKMQIKRMIATYYAAKWAFAYHENNTKLQQEILGEVSKFDDPDLFVFIGNAIFYLPQDPNKPNGQFSAQMLSSLAGEMSKHIKPDSSVKRLCEMIQSMPELREQMSTFFASGSPYKSWQETKKYCKSAIELSKKGLSNDSQELARLILKSSGHNLFICDAIEMFEYCFGTENGRSELLKLLPDSDQPSENKELFPEYVYAIPDWYTLGPIPNPTYELFDTVLPLENEAFDPNAENIIDGKSYRWERYLPGRQMGMCNIDYDIDGKDEKNILYVGRWIEAPEAGAYNITITKAFMGFTVFVDGEKAWTVAYTDNKWRSQGGGVYLSKGRHFIMFKFSQENNQYSFWAVIRKPNGQPLAGGNGCEDDQTQSGRNAAKQNVLGTKS